MPKRAKAYIVGFGYHPGDDRRPRFDLVARRSRELPCCEALLQLQIGEGPDIFFATRHGGSLDGPTRAGAPSGRTAQQCSPSTSTQLHHCQAHDSNMRVQLSYRALLTGVTTTTFAMSVYGRVGVIYVHVVKKEACHAPVMLRRKIFTSRG